MRLRSSGLTKGTSLVLKHGIKMAETRPGQPITRYFLHDLTKPNVVICSRRLFSSRNRNTNRATLNDWGSSTTSSTVKTFATEYHFHQLVCLVELNGAQGAYERKWFLRDYNNDW